MSLDRFLIVEANHCVVHFKTMQNIARNSGHTGPGKSEGCETWRTRWDGRRCSEVIDTTTWLNELS